MQQVHHEPVGIFRFLVINRSISSNHSYDKTQRQFLENRIVASAMLTAQRTGKTKTLGHY